MTTQQFLKGLMMAIMAVVVAAFSTTPIDYLFMALTALCAILTYVGKNLIAVLHSDSPPGTLSLINIISALLIALGSGILEAGALIIVNGVILWAVLWKVVVSTTLTYVLTTWFAPPYNVTKRRVFSGFSQAA